MSCSPAWRSTAATSSASRATATVRRRGGRRRLDDGARGRAVRRRYGVAVRLEIAHDCPEELAAYLLEHFRLTPRGPLSGPGPVNLNRLLAVYDSWTGPTSSTRRSRRACPNRSSRPNIFDAIAKRDILLHHPFESFAPVVDFVVPGRDRSRRARDQADALSHRGPTRRSSRALIGRESRQGGHGADRAARALRRGGQHRAREQAAGGRRARGLRRGRLQDALQDGAGRAARARQLRRYVHLGTGNYHPRTARAYTDYGLLSADDALGEDVHQVFMQLTGLCARRRSEPAVAVAVQAARPACSR